MGNKNRHIIGGFRHGSQKTPVRDKEEVDKKLRRGRGPDRAHEIVPPDDPLFRGGVNRGSGMVTADGPVHERKFSDDRAPHSSKLKHRHQHHRHEPQDELNVWVFLLCAMAVIFFSGVLLHLLSDASEKNSRSQYKKRLSSRTRIRRKKKTDEWSEDALSEEDLLNERAGVAQHQVVVDDTRPPNVYYPYQPQISQEPRHRKPSSSNVVVAQQPNFRRYPNQSGSAAAGAAAALTRTPIAARPVVTAATAQSMSRSPGAPGRSPRIPEQQQAAVTHQDQESIFQQSSHERSFARPISTTASSFESLTEPDLKELQDQHHTPPDTVPQSPQRSPLAATGSVASRHSKILLSPGAEDLGDDSTPRMGQVHSNRLRMSDLIEKTPRVANTRQAQRLYVPSVPERSPMLTQQQQQQGPPSSDSVPEFASPPRQKRPQQPTQQDIPFVPSLDVHVAETRPPRSINIEDLHLYQMMESGSVSHWEARVAEESRMLQNKVLQHSQREQEGNIRDSVLQASGVASEDSSFASIPSGDPRKSILHKRQDLTTSTDACASLQGQIDFSELKLVEVIGGGGFGQVWKAVWRGTPVAVKVLTGSAQSKTVPRAVLEEFAAEINLLKGMRHPNICLYMGACLEPPNRAIITELAANGSLWDALRLPLAAPYVACDGLSRKGWPVSLYQPDARHGAPPVVLGTTTLPAVPPRGTWHWVLVKRVACGAARGMAYLHSGKPPILHRDLKSANILLDESYTAKVCDFGLSRIKAQERSMTGNCGTVQWMAPEVLANTAYNEKADVFSYGIICWELLTRQCPYDGMSPIQCALAVLNHDKRPEIPKWCPPPLHALIRSCVKKDPDERPTFTQVISALDAMPDG